MNLKSFGKTVVASAVCVGVGYLAYAFAVPENKKTEIEERCREVESRLGDLIEIVRPYLEQLTHPSSVNHANRDETIREWEALGY